MNRLCCCKCGKSCFLGSDNFNRDNSNDPGDLWSIESGDWAIKDNKLINGIVDQEYPEDPATVGQPGVLATTICHPPRAKLGSFYAIFEIVNYEDGKIYRFGAGNPNSISVEGKITINKKPETDFTYILTMELSNGSGSNNKIQNTGYEFSFDPNDENAQNLKISFCYAPGLMTSLYPGEFGDSSNQYWLDLCISSSDVEPCHQNPSGDYIGNFSFRQGDFDNWSYYLHWLDDNDCPYCGCFCTEKISNEETAVICWPKKFKLYLVSPYDCPNIPASYELLQAWEGAADPGGLIPPNISESNQLFTWVSDEILMGGNPYTANNRPYYFRWKLDCATEDFTKIKLPYPKMKLQLMFYTKCTPEFCEPTLGSDPLPLTSDPAGFGNYLGFDNSYPETIDFIQDDMNYRTNSLSKTDSTCEPIKLKFAPIKERRLVFGTAIFLCAQNGYHSSDNIDGDEFEYNFEVEIVPL